MNDKDRPSGKPTIQIENDRVRVVEWRFPPGAHTGWHKHDYDYVVVPITSGELKIFDGKSTVPAPLRSGIPYFREAGVEHDVINDNDFEFIFIETEIKA
jgi:beta-alanine degradation protein BauB